MDASQAYQKVKSIASANADGSGNEFISEVKAHVQHAAIGLGAGVLVGWYLKKNLWYSAVAGILVATIISTIVSRYE